MLGFDESTRLTEWCCRFGIDISGGVLAQPSGSDQAIAQHRPKFLNVTTEVSTIIPENRVIEQDVLRTRGGDPLFKNHCMKVLLQHALLKYCAYYSITYMQGLNEIMSPMLTLTLAVVTLVVVRVMPALAALAQSLLVAI
jgi:hypothetical protein